MLAPGENGETSKFLWPLLSLLIRPEWYPDKHFSDLKRFGITKEFFLKHKCGESFFTRTQSFAQHFCTDRTRCHLVYLNFDWFPV